MCVNKVLCDLSICIPVCEGFQSLLQSTILGQILEKHQSIRVRLIFK